MNILFLNQDLEDLKALRTEVSQKHRAAGQACGEASEQGESFAGHDNAPFEMAKQEQEIYARKLRQIDEMLSKATAVELKPNDGSVKFGRVVKLENQSSQETSWFLIGSPWSKQEGDGSEHDPMRVSYMSPIVKAIIGRRSSDIVSLKLGDQVQKLKIIEVC